VGYAASRTSRKLTQQKSGGNLGRNRNGWSQLQYL
jgi:hypothetical protein